MSYVHTREFSQESSLLPRVGFGLREWEEHYQEVFLLIPRKADTLRDNDRYFRHHHYINTGDLWYLKNGANTCDILKDSDPPSIGIRILNR